MAEPAASPSVRSGSRDRTPGRHPETRRWSNRLRASTTRRPRRVCHRPSRRHGSTAAPAGAAGRSMPWNPDQTARIRRSTPGHRALPASDAPTCRQPGKAGRDGQRASPPGAMARTGALPSSCGLSGSSGGSVVRWLTYGTCVSAPYARCRHITNRRARPRQSC